MLQYDGNPANKCTCFMFLKSTMKTRLLLKLWEERIVELQSTMNQVSVGNHLSIFSFPGADDSVLGHDQATKPSVRCFSLDEHVNPSSVEWGRSSCRAGDMVHDRGHLSSDKMRVLYGVVSVYMTFSRLTLFSRPDTGP